MKILALTLAAILCSACAEDMGTFYQSAELIDDDPGDEEGTGYETVQINVPSEDGEALTAQWTDVFSGLFAPVYCWWKNITIAGAERFVCKSVAAECVWDPYVARIRCSRF